VGYAAPQTVNGQPREALPFGLFSSFTFRASPDEHWSNGVVWEALSCDPAQVLEPDCDTPPTNAYVSGALGDAPGITVSGSYKCGTPGGRADVQAVEKATAHLLTQEEAAVEGHVWERLHAEAQALTPAPKTALEAVAMLEDYIGVTFGVRSLIHASRGVVTLLGDTLHRNGLRLYTPLETQIVAGAGYSASHPNTLYATPALFGYRSAVYTTTLIDPHTNDAYATAQRQYVVAWDPCPVASVTITP
jgi:hypothetical protein